MEGRGGAGYWRGGEGSGGKGRGGANFMECILMRELASIQYIHKPSHNAALPLRLWYYKYKIVFRYKL